MVQHVGPGVHDLALQFAYLAAGGGDGSAFKVAIVTTAGVVIAAGLTAFAATFQKRSTTEPTSAVPPPVLLPPSVVGSQTADDLIKLTRQMRSELIRRAERAERRAEAAEVRIDELEALCWSHGVNPQTGEMSG